MMMTMMTCWVWVTTRCVVHGALPTPYRGVRTMARCKHASSLRAPSPLPPTAVQGRINDLLNEILHQGDEGLDDDDLPLPITAAAPATAAAGDGKDGADALALAGGNSELEAILRQFPDSDDEDGEDADGQEQGGQGGSGSSPRADGGTGSAAGSSVRFAGGKSGSAAGLVGAMGTPYRQSELELAAARENSLLHQGNRDMVSPLQVKRRLRTKTRSRTRSLTHKR